MQQDALSRSEALQLFSSLLELPGSCGSVGTSYKTLWDDGGDLIGALTSLSGVVSVASSSASDTAAGTGARTVTVVGVVDGEIVSETVALNGQTKVDLAQPFEAIVSVGVASVGSGNENAGAISVGHGSVTSGAHGSGSRMAWVPAGNGRSQTAHLRVPSGRRGMVVGVQVWGSGAGVAQLVFRTGGGIEVMAEGPVAAGVVWAPSLMVPPVAPEGADILLRLKSASGTIQGAGRLAVALHEG